VLLNLLRFRSSCLRLLLSHSPHCKCMVDVTIIITATECMGVRRNFSRGGNVDILLIFFNANGPSQNALRFPDHKEIPHESKRSVRVCLKLYSGGVVFVFAKRSYFFVILYSFYWIEVSSNIIIIIMSLNWSWNIHNCVCGAQISLCGLNLTSQILVWNVFSLWLSEMLFLFIN